VRRLSALVSRRIASLLAGVALSCYGTRRSAEGGRSPRSSLALRSRGTALGARLKAARLSARLPRVLMLRDSVLGWRLLASRLACLALSCCGTRRSAEGRCSPRSSPTERSRATALSARLKAARLPRAIVPRHSALSQGLLLASRLAGLALSCYATRRSAGGGCSPLGSPLHRALVQRHSAPC
jgi:hypothetical protein